MSTIDTLNAEIRRTPIGSRAPLYDRIAKDYGRGFMEQLRDAIEASEMIEANEASIKRR
jgi:hypothetical protein